MRILFLIAFSLVSLLSFGQGHICGMSTKEQVEMMENFERAVIDKEWVTKRGEKIYIPVKFHLVADNAGKGRIEYSKVLAQLQRLNNDYKSHNFVFYLKDNTNAFLTMNNTNVFDNPRNNENLMRPRKDQKAVNIFIVNKIGDSQGGPGIVLGYYSPTSDFVVIMKNQVENADNNTLSHEIGHFFSLAHTFLGWESDPYTEDNHGNPCAFEFAPGTNIPVELVKRTNCKQAADKLCDTPPDYNFGISANGCSFGKIVRDRNLDTIRPMRNNHMSYFSNCGVYKFTEEQETKMRGNFASVLRADIRSNYIPKTDSILIQPKIILPKANRKYDVYTNVDFEWEDQNADYYLLEVRNSNEYYHYLLPNTTKYTAKNLLANKIYVLTLVAFRDGTVGSLSNAVNFRTGNIMTSIEEQSDISSLSIYPNPVTDSKLKVDINSNNNQNIKLNILDYTGRIVLSSLEKINYGSNSIELDLSNISNGLYILEITNGKGSATEKLIIQK